jgi:uncharacterized membrane protein
MSKRTFTVLILQALALSSIFSFLPACSGPSAYPEPSRIGRDAVVDVSRLPSETPEFFTYHYGGKNINFFVVRTKDTVLSFLDACVRCYTEKRGYRYEGGYVICRACNMKYPVSEVGKGFGGCYPIRLAGHVQNGKYYIPLLQLEGQADKF